MAAAIAADGTMAAAAGTAAPTDYEPVWIDTPECQSCDECTQINEKIFAYNDEKKAIIVDPRGGPYKDIVRAAEKFHFPLHDRQHLLHHHYIA